MKLYNANDVTNIVEDMFAKQFGFETVYLGWDQKSKLMDLLIEYGTEFPNIEENV